MEKQTIYTDSLENHGYEKLKAWIEDSLDQFKQELMQILYPIFIHIYFDLIIQKKNYEHFFKTYKGDFNKAEIEMFSSLSDAQHIKENTQATAYRTEKYTISMGKYAFNLLLNFLEENELNYILKLINQYIDIKVYVGQKREIEGLVSCSMEPINLTTFLVSRECEDSILKDEKYKYDHLETFVSQLRKKRENKNSGYSGSYVSAEIEKLKDITKRITCNAKNLPSICCYTVFNTYEELTCSEISPDSRILALGFKNSTIEVHALDQPLKKLKKSSELEKSEMKETYDESALERLVGHQGPVFSLRFFQTGKFLLSSSHDCTVRLWSLELFSLISIYKAGFPIWCVDVTKDFYFAMGGADRVASIYSIMNNKPERIFTALSDVTVVKFHPNSNYLFFGSSDTYVRMVDIHSAKLVRVFNGHTDTITCIDVSHCGQLLATGSKDRSVILWDINSSKILSTFKAHTSCVYSVSFCWFGSILASCGADCSVQLYDTSDPKAQALATFYTKSTPLHCCKFGYRNILSVVGPYQ